MSLSGIQILVVIILIVLLFGRGRISSLMGEVAKGIKSFRAGLKDETQDGAGDDMSADSDDSDVIEVSKKDNDDHKPDQ